MTYPTGFDALVASVNLNQLLQLVKTLSIESVNTVWSVQEYREYGYPAMQGL